MCLAASRRVRAGVCAGSSSRGGLGGSHGWPMTRRLFASSVCGELGRVAGYKLVLYGAGHRPRAHLRRLTSCPSRHWSRGGVDQRRSRVSCSYRVHGMADGTALAEQSLDLPGRSRRSTPEPGRAPRRLPVLPGHHRPTCQLATSPTRSVIARRAHAPSETASSLNWTHTRRQVALIVSPAIDPRRAQPSVRA